MNQPWPPQLLGRWIAALLLISLVFGTFGEMYVPVTLLNSGSAGATAYNILHHQMLFRLGVASYAVEGLCDASLTALLYLLLRPAGRELALVALSMRIVATAAFAASMFFYFAALSILRADYLAVFPREQIDALALLLLRLYGSSGSIPTLFYGVAWIVMGRLMFASGYLPRWLGGLLALGGFSTMAGMFLNIAAPAYATPILLLPMIVGMLVLAVWLLAVGVTLPIWQKQTPSLQSDLAGA